MSAAEAARQAARITDSVEHGLGMLGTIGGLVLGAAVGAILVAATVATGGGALAIAIAAVGAVGATAGGGLAGGQLLKGLSTIFGSSGITTGAIVPATSPNVRTGNLFAARAMMDGAACSGLATHFPLPKSLIAEGSATVRINSLPAARQGDKLVCGGDIQRGEPTVHIGGGTVQVLAIHDNEAWLQDVLGKVAFGSLIGVGLLLGGGFLAGAICGAVVLEAIGVGFAFFAGNALLGVVGDKLGPGWRDTLQGGFGIAALVGGGYRGLRSIETGRPLLGEPVDGVTGEVCIRKTDLLLPGALDLRLERSYASGLEYGSCFGPKWCSTWGQWIEEAGSNGAIYYSDDGRSIGFELNGPDWVRNPLVDKIFLRRAPDGFEIRHEPSRILRFHREVNRRYVLTSVEDRNGNSVRFEHDDAGALREVVHSGGYTLAIESTPTQIRRISLQEIGGAATELIRYEYDDGGRLSAVIDGSGLPFRYEYDAQARITRWRDRERTWYEYRYDSNGRCVEAFGPEAMYHYRFQYNETGRTNQIVDSLGGITTITYNERLQVVERIDARGGVTRTTWDGRSNKLEETDPSGRKISYAYDSNGDLTAVVDPLGRTTQITYEKPGLPIVLTDPAGRRWLKAYDSRGNLVEAGLAGHPGWRYEYDERGNLVRVTDPIGNNRLLYYDRRGLLVWATDWEQKPTSLQRDAQGRIVLRIDPLGNRTGFRYNRLGKLAEVTLATGTTLAWEYDAEGNLQRRIAPGGRTFSYSYTSFDLLKEIQKPSGTRLRLRYDTEGRLTVVENEVGELYQYEYNQTGQFISEQDFAGRRLRFEYDASGFCTKRINGLGEEISLERDASGQLVRRFSVDDEALFEYDPNGRITKAKNSAAEVLFGRDDFGRVISENQNGHVVESQYDDRGLRLKRRTSSGNEIDWRYDRNGLHVGLDLPGAAAFEFLRDAAGREVERRTRGGFVLRQEYDPLDRLTSQWAGVTSAASNPPEALAERRYRYDESDNPIEIWDRRWGTDSFSYDRDDRIIAARKDRGATEEFTYDPAGNIEATTVRLSAATSPKFEFKAGLTARFYSKGGRLERTSETRYAFDDDGRLTEKRVGQERWQYEWNTEGQLLGVRTPKGERWAYEYDALGRRVRKVGPNGEAAYVWDGAVIAQEIRASSPPTAWVFEPGTFRPLAKQESGKAYACVVDQVGTPRELVTSSGRLAWSARLSAWGKVEERATQTACTIRFQGQWYDEESSLHYNFHRYYDPETGQYLSPDPIGFEGGTRSYGYVHNPVGWIDPLGLTGCGAGGEASVESGQVLPKEITGRPPASAAEQMVMRAAMEGEGGVIMRGPFGDPKFQGPGWVKMQVVGRGTESNITVHYMKNILTTESAQFKFATEPYAGPTRAIGP